MRLSQSYPSHQRSLDYPPPVPTTKKTPSPSSYPHDPDTRKLDRRPSPNRTSHRLMEAASTTDNGCYDIRTSSPKRPTSSNSSSSSDIWLTTSDRTVTKSPRGRGSSGMSTPLEEVAALTIPREIILTRPGSAPSHQQQEAVDGVSVVLEAQQRSLSLPKSFLSPGNYNTLRWVIFKFSSRYSTQQKSIFQGRSSFVLTKKVLVSLNNYNE